MHTINFSKLELYFDSLFVIVVAILVGKIINYLLRKYIEKSAKILKLNPTNYSFIQSFISFAIFLFCAYYIIHKFPKLNTLSQSIFAGAGIIVAALGFASQEAFSNLVSGIFILITKPFSVGDSIKLENKGIWGIVEDITMRHTILRGIENRRIVIPNAIINREMIQNASLKDPRINLNFDMTVSPETDVDTAFDIIYHCILSNPLYADVLTKEEKENGKKNIHLFIPTIDRNGVKLRASVWCKGVDEAYDLKCSLFETVLKRFQEKKIVLSYAVLNEHTKII